MSISVYPLDPQTAEALILLNLVLLGVEVDVSSTLGAEPGVQVQIYGAGLGFRAQA